MKATKWATIPKDEICQCIDAIAAAANSYSNEVRTAALHAIFSECMKQGLFKVKPVVDIPNVEPKS